MSLPKAALEPRFVLRLALAAVVLAVISHTRADPDLWGHVRFGQDMIAARAVRVPDTYSFTSDRPWVNHEWLAECVMSAAYALAGAAGLVLLKVVLVLIMLTAVVACCRNGMSAISRDFMMGIVLIATVPQANHVRPQLFSLALFGVLLLVMRRSAAGSPRLLLSAVPLLAVWANLHGGWLVGIATLALWTAAGLVGRSDARERLLSVLTATFAVAATLLNPYGAQLWGFLRTTVGFGRADIGEWQPMYRALDVAPIWAVLVVLMCIALAHAYRTRTLDVRGAAVTGFLAVASFRVNRLLSFFAIALVMLLGPALVAALERYRSSGTTRAAEPRAASIAATIIGLVLLAGGATVSVGNARCVRMDGPFIPDSEVSSLVAGQRLHGRMLTWFDWGEYAIWHFAPAITVSMDGRRETVYSDEMIQRHLRFYFVPEERQQILSSLQPDFVWLPTFLPVTHQLQADGWKPLFTGSRSVLLAREGGVPPPARFESQAVRCFPGP